MPQIKNHPLRFQLANELHARPFPTVATPNTVVYLAIKQPGGAAARDRSADMDHLNTLLQRHGAAPPQPGATHHTAQIGRHRLKWESHTEFVTYTAFCDGLSGRPFDPDDFAIFPDDWLAVAPGLCITSLAMRICPRPGQDGEIPELLADWFVPESLAVARVLDDSAVVAGDFRIDPGGHLRFAIFVTPGTGQRRVGRIVQRLCEVETYKTMSLLGFARAREISPVLAGTGARLSRLVGEMGQADRPAETTLEALLQVSGELEGLAAQTSFRFAATGAYEAIVHERIEALRESRFIGRLTFGEFMQRRYEPAMRTVRATENRLKTLGERAMRAADLLRTRVDVERSAQNQALLASMDKRADLALRLQHTVEGLSVVAISYYAVSLGGYLIYPLAQAMGISKGIVIAVITLPVIGGVWWAVRRVRKKLD